MNATTPPRTPSGTTKNLTAFENVVRLRDRTRTYHQEFLATFAPYLHSEILPIVASLDVGWDDARTDDTSANAADLGAIAGYIFVYLAMARRLDIYRRKRFGNRTPEDMATKSK